MILAAFRRWHARLSVRDCINIMGWHGLLKVLIAIARHDGNHCTFHALQAAQVAAQNDAEINAARCNVVRMPHR